MFFMSNRLAIKLTEQKEELINFIEKITNQIVLIEKNDYKNIKNLPRDYVMGVKDTLRNIIKIIK